MRTFPLPKHSSANYEEKHEGVAAQKWLADHISFINKKWRRLEIRCCGKTRQTFQDESGSTEMFLQPETYYLTYYRSRFRLFGHTEQVEISFQESDVESVIFRREPDFAPCDADYYIHVSLTHGAIDLQYTPPFFAFSLSSLGSREEIRIQFPIKYQPYKS